MDDMPLPAVKFEDAAPQTRMLEKKRQLYDASTALDNAKSDFRSKEALLQEREGELRQRDGAFHAEMLAATQQLNDNQTKQKRAEKRQVDERKAMLQKQDEIADGLKQLHVAKDELTVVDVAKAKLQKYFDYLADFQAEHPQAFPEIGTVTERYAVLQAAQRDLIAEADRLQDLLEHQRGAVGRAAKDSQTTALNAENLLTSLRERIESVRAEVLGLQAGAEGAAARHGRRTLELGKVLQSVANLHGRALHSDYGRVIKHNPHDSDALGMPIPDFSAELGLPPIRRDSDDEVSETEQAGQAGTPARRKPKTLDSTTMSLVGPGMEDEAWLAEHIEAAKAGATLTSPLAGTGNLGASGFSHTPMRTHAAGSAARAVFLSAASPRRRHGGHEAGGEDEEGSPGSGSPKTGGHTRLTKPIDITGMEPAQIRDKVRIAMGQLYTVGAFIQDFQSIVDGYPKYLAEKRKNEAENAAAAAAAAAVAQAEADFREKLKNKQSASSATPKKAASGAGVGSSSAFAGAGAGSANALFTPIKVKGSTGPGASSGGFTGRGSAVSGSKSGYNVGGSSMGGGISSSMWNSMTGTAGAKQGNSSQMEKVAAVLQKQGAKVYTVSAAVQLPPPTEPVALPLERPNRSPAKAGGVSESSALRSSSLR